MASGAYATPPSIRRQLKEPVPARNLDRRGGQFDCFGYFRPCIVADTLLSVHGNYAKMRSA
jgi:hypothetical protein